MARTNRRTHQEPHHRHDGSSRPARVPGRKTVRTVKADSRRRRQPGSGYQWGYSGSAKKYPQNGSAVVAGIRPGGGDNPQAVEHGGKAPWNIGQENGTALEIYHGG